MTSLATERRSTGSRGCWTLTKKPAPCQSRRFEERAAGLGVNDLDVRLPDGRALLEDLDLDVVGGESLLVKGQSGSGKTTLLRSLAGLWPYVEGSIEKPEPGNIMFCAQQPYLPLGTLRTALAYPAPGEEAQRRRRPGCAARGAARAPGRSAGC